MQNFISKRAWRLSLIFRSFGFSAPSSLKIGKFSSLCEAEHASTVDNRAPGAAPKLADD